MVNNSFPAKGFPIDELNRLALDRVKSISALSAHSAVKGIRQLRLLKFERKFVFKLTSALLR